MRLYLEKREKTEDDEKRRFGMSGARRKKEGRNRKESPLPTKGGRDSETGRAEEKEASIGEEKRKGAVFVGECRLKKKEEIGPGLPRRNDNYHISSRGGKVRWT